MPSPLDVTLRPSEVRAGTHRSFHAASTPWRANAEVSASQSASVSRRRAACRSPRAAAAGIGSAGSSPRVRAGSLRRSRAIAAAAGAATPWLTSRLIVSSPATSLSLSRRWPPGWSAGGPSPYRRCQLRRLAGAMPSRRATAPAAHSTGGSSSTSSDGSPTPKTSASPRRARSSSDRRHRTWSVRVNTLDNWDPPRLRNAFRVRPVGAGSPGRSVGETHHKPVCITAPGGSWDTATTRGEPTDDFCE
jgi:hypothetical protein